MTETLHTPQSNVRGDKMSFYHPCKPQSIQDTYAFFFRLEEMSSEEKTREEFECALERQADDERAHKLLTALPDDRNERFAAVSWLYEHGYYESHSAFGPGEDEYHWLTLSDKARRVLGEINDADLVLAYQREQKRKRNAYDAAWQADANEAELGLMGV